MSRQRSSVADFDIAVTAILIQRTVGGNLAEILASVGHTIAERARIRAEIRVLTSQGRLTGYVIGAIPMGLLGLFMLVNPDFTGQLFTEPMGNALLAAAGVGEFFGFLTIRKIVNIEV